MNKLTEEIGGNTYTVYMSPSLGVLEPERIRASQGLRYDPTRIHGKHRSTDLYTTDDWCSAADTIAIQRGSIAEKPWDQLSVFRVPDDIFEVLRERYAGNTAAEGGYPFAVDAEIRIGLNQLLRNLFGPSSDFSIDEKAILLRSNPAKGVATGQTTNGFHFDIGNEDSLRVGINLGDVPRYVYYVPVSRATLLPGRTRDECQRLYREISGTNIPVVSVRVDPGEGWSLATTEYLHDGRRAQAEGLSRFVLFTAVAVCQS
jgi:hypothetical protein